MAEHTPTPWQLCHHLQSAEKDASCPCGYRGGIWGDGGELLVCEMRNCNLHEGHDMTPVGDRATQLANAAFIVKAVNNHFALVKRLASLEQDLRVYAGGLKEGDDLRAVLELNADEAARTLASVGGSGT
jgi:hypothetical protein